MKHQSFLLISTTLVLCFLAFPLEARKKDTPLGWVKLNKPEEMDSKKIRNNICSAIIDGYDYHYADDYCKHGKIKRYQVYRGFDRDIRGRRVKAKAGDKSNDGFKVVTTVQRIQVEFQNKVCRVEIRGIFPHKRVSYNGKVVVVGGNWDADIDGCEKRANKNINDADIGDGHVKEIPFDKIPEAVRYHMGVVDLPFELGDGYYDIVNEDSEEYKEEYKQSYFVVFDPTSSKKKPKVLGYIESTWMTYTEGYDDEPSQYLVRYDAEGHRVSDIGEYD